MADAMSFPSIPGNGPVARALAWLHRELGDLRRQAAEGVRTREVVIVDPAGRPRIRLTADADGRIVLLDAEGTERVRLVAQPDRGAVSLRGRPTGRPPLRRHRAHRQGHHHRRPRRHRRPHPPPPHPRPRRVVQPALGGDGVVEEALERQVERDET